MTSSHSNRRIEAFLAKRHGQQRLRFLTCGSVDDGKSTLIGRLLVESRGVFDDQMSALESDSRKYGTQGDRLDVALLLDGLQAEREQGITIDVAYRFFESEERSFVVADAPGHEQYTRNMATAASTAQLAVVLVDARKGVLVQTRRHSRIVSMMGVRHVVLVVNKMDLVGFDGDTFDAIVAEYRAFADDGGFASVDAIPVSALHGDNVVARSSRTPWYRGTPLLEYLNRVDITEASPGGSFRMPVQWVNRPSLDFRGLCGRVAAGAVAAGDRVRVLPSGVETAVREVLVWGGGLKQAEAGDAVTLRLADEVDASRGNVIVAAGDPCEVADQFQARVLWMAEHDLVAGRPYLLKLQCQEVTATITAIKFRADVNTGAHLAARTLGLNEIGIVTISVSHPLVFEPYASNRTMGGFILIDKLTFATVAAGMIDFALRRAFNLPWQNFAVDRTARSQLMHQRARCIWFTGLSGSGKSTIANLLEKALHASGKHTYVLDGDNVRHGLNRDLGFTEADRAENIRRIGEVARLMVDAGLIVLVSFISPFRAERRQARDLFRDGEFVEVFVDTPMEICESRDAKGLYAKARRGELANFTGIDSPYERPEAPDIRLTPTDGTVEDAVAVILRYLGEV